MRTVLRPSENPAHLLVYLLAVPAALLAAGCSDDDDDDGGSFVVRTATNAADADAKHVVGSGWVVYFADEGTSGGPSEPSPDLNGDGDIVDDVAVAAKLGGSAETPLRAAQAAAVVSAQVYLVVDEAEDGNWDADVADNLVLLHWSQSADVVTFVDGLDPAGLLGEPLMVQEDRVYYASSAAPIGDETSLRYIDKDDPLTPVTVMNQVGGGALQPIVLGESEGLLFLALDETGPAVDYNQDADITDTAVLALLDGTDEAETVLMVPLALADTAAPFDARRGSAQSEWLLAVLVNELAQGAQNLNDPSLFTNPLMPDSCVGTPDADTDDDVLFFARYEDLLLATPAVNTGLAGRDRVVVVDDFVATLTDELDATCDMNEDGDTLDTVPRWVEAVDPVAPPRDPSQLEAAFDVPGGSHGLAAIDNNLVMVVSEAADDTDVNSDGDQTDTLAGFLVPADGFATTWTFSHPDDNPGTGIPNENFVGLSWMGEDEANDRLAMAFQESVTGDTLNVDLFCDFVTKDADATDSLPVWADFEGGGFPILDFDGQGYAILEADPGIVIANGWVFYRVSEAADNFDYNNDSDENDVILFRNPQTTCATFAMATASTLAGTNPVVETDGLTGCVFMTSEFQAGLDMNEDGDTNDLVPRWFPF
ncbi:MAG: hypothetical protein L0206_21300 [Actinobacteria bacterium]|nr:hypothetical protein [Actinomycetota bacterium]